MGEPYPTFDLCPECRAMVWTDSRRLWCIECDWSTEQGTLFDDSEHHDPDT